MKLRLGIALFLLASPLALNAFANHYLPKPSERPIPIRLGTSAVSGGFMHLYSALDYGIFEKYGFKTEHIYIRGQSPALAALANDELQFNYGAAEGSLPGLAAGVEVKVVASPLVKLPYILVARKDIRRPEDLKGKAIGVTRPGDLSARLSRAVLKKFGLSTDEVIIRPIGGSQTERYQAMVGNVVQAILVTPPLDVRAKQDGFNVIYRLIELELPFIYSSLMTNYKMLRDRPDVVQRMVAALAESIGRLPYSDGDGVAQAQRVIVALAGLQVGVSDRLGVAKALEALSRAVKGVALTEPALDVLRSLLGVVPAARAESLAGPAPVRTGGAAPDPSRDARVRRLAMGALLSSGLDDEVTIDRAFADSDPQVRRLAVRAAARTSRAAAVTSGRPRYLPAAVEPSLLPTSSAKSAYMSSARCAYRCSRYHGSIFFGRFGSLLHFLLRRAHSSCRSLRAVTSSGMLAVFKVEPMRKCSVSIHRMRLSPSTRSTSVVLNWSAHRSGE